MKRLAVALALVTAVVAPALPATGQVEPARLVDVTVEIDGDRSAVRVRTSAPARPDVTTLSRPDRIVLDFADTAFAWRGSPLAAPGGGPVKQVRGSQYRKGVSRVVIELTRKTEFRVEPDAGGLRVTLGPAAVAAEPPTTAPVPPAVTREPAARIGATAPFLHGTVIVEDRGVAYLEDPRSRRVAPYRVGDRVGDGTLEAIAVDHVVVRSARGGALEIRIDAPKPPPPDERPASPLRERLDRPD